MYCGVRNFPLKCITKVNTAWGKQGKAEGRKILALTNLANSIFFSGSKLRYEVHQNRVRIATAGGGESSQTDVTDAGDFIMCRMLCCSNGTDNYVAARRHICFCFMAKSAFWRGFSALAPYTGVGPI